MCSLLSSRLSSFNSLKEKMNREWEKYKTEIQDNYLQFKLKRLNQTSFRGLL